MDAIVHAFFETLRVLLGEPDVVPDRDENGFILHDCYTYHYKAVGDEIVVRIIEWEGEVSGLVHLPCTADHADFLADKITDDEYDALGNKRVRVLVMGVDELEEMHTHLIRVYGN